MHNEKSLRILMLEDSQDDINLIERVLKVNKMPFIAEHVDTREEFTRAVKTFRPDVVLSDHGLPQFNSREALKICLQERTSIPFIIVTGTMSDEFAISCLHEGADDYILKSNLSRLPLAIHRAVKERRLEKLKREARHALRRQNSELLKVNVELDNFVYSVSHNLRGPLASVLGLLGVARLEDKEKKLDHIHGMMHESIQKLDETLKEILDYSRNARAEIHQDDIQWESVIQKSLTKLEHLQNFNDVRITTAINAPVPFYSDARRLRAIFINLLSNAITFRDEKKESVIAIDIDVNEQFVVVTIRDNGVGIRAENLSKIFNMFYRGTELSQGAGLGLYITQEVIKKLKGEIKISSTFGTETIVSVTIPNTPFFEGLQ